MKKETNICYLTPELEVVEIIVEAGYMLSNLEDPTESDEIDW